MRASKLVTAELWFTGTALAGAGIELASLAAGAAPSRWGTGLWAFCVLVWTARGLRYLRRLRKAYRRIEAREAAVKRRENYVRNQQLLLQWRKELGEMQ